MWKLVESFPGKPYVNRGISGQTTPQMLVRMFPDVIDLEPAAFILLAGTNDISRNTGPETLTMPSMWITTRPWWTTRAC
jgi:lysophospholipase L1-like esterase